MLEPATNTPGPIGQRAWVVKAEDNEVGAVREVVRQDVLGALAAVRPHYAWKTQGRRITTRDLSIHIGTSVPRLGMSRPRRSEMKRSTQSGTGGKAVSSLMRKP